jgi:hypothetical protein
LQKSGCIHEVHLGAELNLINKFMLRLAGLRKRCIDIVESPVCIEAVHGGCFWSPEVQNQQQDSKTWSDILDHRQYTHTKGTRRILCVSIFTQGMTSLSPFPSLTTLICLPSSFAFETLTSKYDLWQITMNSKGDHAVDFSSGKIYAVL